MSASQDAIDMLEWKWPWFNNGHATYVQYRRNELLPDGDPIPVECPYRGYKRFAFNRYHVPTKSNDVLYVWVENEAALLRLLAYWTNDMWVYTAPVVRVPPDAWDRDDSI